MESGTPMPARRFVEPHVVVSHFHIKEGDTVADYGAGSGYFLNALAEAVGHGGRVYACEIQRELVETLGNRARSAGLGNVDPLWCDLEEERGIKIDSEVVDVGVLVNTLFQFEEKRVALIEIGRTMRSGGHLYVIDWTDSFAGLGPQPQAVVPEETAKELLEQAGFSFVRSFAAGDHHYGLAFQKL